MKLRSGLNVVGLLAVATFAASQPATAAALFFAKVAVKTSSEKTCLSFAADSLRGFKNVHRSSSEVAGEKDGAYVSVTCVGRGQQPAIAVIMSVSDASFDTAKQVGQSVATQIAKIQCIDTPC